MKKDFSSAASNYHTPVNFELRQYGLQLEKVMGMGFSRFCKNI